MKTPIAMRRQGGFTVTEMLVTIGIVALLAAIAAPNLGGMVRTQRIKTAAFDVFSSLTFARSEAIKRNITVTLVNNGSWSKGWRIVDQNGIVLREQSGWENVDAPLGPTSVAFTSSGRLPSGAGFTLIQLTAKGYGSTMVNRCVRVDPSGRASVRESAC